MDIKLDSEKRQLLGWKQTIETIELDDPGRMAVDYLTDIRRIEANFGIGDTYSAHVVFVDFETYVVLVDDTMKQLFLALLVVTVIVLLITVSLQATLIIVFCVLLVNVYMLAVTQYWGLTFNNIVAVNLSFALGVALDYSSHIGHTYLSI